MENQNNDEIKKLQDDLAQKSDNGAMQSEEQVKQSQDFDGVSTGPSESDEAQQDAQDSNTQFVPQPHEQRVIDEHQDVYEKVQKLIDFINNNPIFKTFTENGQFLMRAQLFHMMQYCAILNERIYVFSTGKTMPKTDGQLTIGDFGVQNEKVFDLKYISAMMIDATNHYGKDGRRNAIVKTDMEKVQMMAVKSVFS